MFMEFQMGCLISHYCSINDKIIGFILELIKIFNIFLNLTLIWYRLQHILLGHFATDYIVCPFSSLQSWVYHPRQICLYTPNSSFLHNWFQRPPVSDLYLFFISSSWILAGPTLSSWGLFSLFFSSSWFLP